MTPLEVEARMGIRSRLGLKGISRVWDSRLAPVRLPGEFVVAGMATMPTRSASFAEAFASLIRQVDKLYLYLDGFAEVPRQAFGHPKVISMLSREVPGLHANGKLLGLILEERPCLYVTADDDLFFRRDFISRMRTGLAAYSDRAVVGYYGCTLERPFQRYRSDRRVIAYTDRLARPCKVDFLGTGATMFASSALRFDVRGWPFPNMVDVGLAIEAARAGLPCVSLARRRREVIQLGADQPDSITLARRRDDSEQTALCHELLRIRDRSTTDQR